MNFKVKASLLESSSKYLLWDKVPLLSDAELLMSPVIKEDSDCFLTVSFHIRRMRLCGDKQQCQNTSEYSLWKLSVIQLKSISSSSMRYETKNIDCHLCNLVFKPLNKSTVGISNLQLKMSVNTGIGKVNNKVISQAPESVSQVAKAQSERVHAG